MSSADVDPLFVTATDAQSGTAVPSPTARRRPLRQASVELRRVDPWAMLKVGLIVSIVMFFVWMLIVVVLYLSFGSLGVWDNVNGTYATLATTNPGPLITATGHSSSPPFSARSTSCCSPPCPPSPRFSATPPQE
jgi:hypothetical protein